MTIIRYEQCLYSGNIKKDFIIFLLKKRDIHFVNKLRIISLYLISLFFRKVELNLWLFINDKLSINEQVHLFCQNYAHKINRDALRLLQGDITIISKSPFFLVKPFVQDIASLVYCGYDIDFEKRTFLNTPVSEGKLKQQIKNKEIKGFRAVDHTISFYVKKASEKFIANQYKTTAINKKYYLKRLGMNIARFIVMVMLCLMIESFILLNSSLPFNKELFISYFHDYVLLCMNFLPIFIFLSFIYLCTRKLWLSFLITEIPFFVLAFANYFKLKYRDYPVVFSDFLILSEAKMMAGKYDIRPTESHLLFIFVSLIIIYVLKKLHSTHIVSRKKRVIIGVVLCLLSGVGFKNVVLNKTIYSQAGDETVLKNRWIESQQLQMHGALYAFLYSYNSAFNQPPENYDENLALEILSAYQTDHIPDHQKVNIITIMLESYNDFTKFDLNFSEDIYSSFHEICNEGYAGELISNVFGGGTVNTERSYLVGCFTSPLYYKKTNSYVYYLKSQGYHTVALHPCYGSFYNRRNVNENIGFDEFYYVENRYNEVSFDDVFFPDIIAEFEKQTATGSPYFNYSLTYQNHGQYPKEYNANIPDYLIGYENVDAGTMNGINYYFNGIKNTNENLKQLHDYLKNSNEPTVLVLFGDHNPVFGSGSDGFEMLGINMDISTIDGFTNYYGVPYVFWANDAAKETLGDLKTGQAPTISPSYLMNELFEYLGWSGNAYMKYTNELMAQMPVYHSSWKMVGDTFTQELDESMNQMMNDHETVEYYYYSHFTNE